MKISLKWAQQYSNVDLQKSKSDELVRKIGAQLGEVEEVVQWGPRFDGIVVVKVTSCEKHSNADKLHVCTVDDAGKTKGVKRGADGTVQVVCGAPNVKAGMLAVWIPPGVTVPSTRDKDPFILEARDIRGVVSNGMLASASELGISDDHSGLLEVTAEEVGKELAKPGTPLKALYNLDDTVIDIENKMFTHRPDCFGILGAAREIAGIQHLAFKSPDWYAHNKEIAGGKGLPLKVRVDDTKLVPRFMAVALSGVTVRPSPVWMQAGLTRVGIRPINNVVDITNFVMHLTAQPLHAYDYDKIKNLSGTTPTLVARQAKKGESLQLLNGKTYEFEAPAILIATDKAAVGVGGVMGGADTEVDETTKNIILECANFDMYSIRKTSMKYGLFTDAVTRFNKGQSPAQTDKVLHYALDLLTQLTGAQPASRAFDVSGRKLTDNPRITITSDFVNERLGTRLSLKDMSRLLENVEFKTIKAPADTKKLHVQAPFWRTDIEIPEDVVEEIGRLYGYDHLPLVLPKRSVTPVKRDSLMQLKSELRDQLSAAGANELLTYSFVHGNLMSKTGQNKENAFQLSNALSPDLQYFRMSLLPSLLDKVHMNIKAGYGEFALFEMNPVHNKDLMSDGLPIEEHRLGFVFAAEDKVASEKYHGAAFYQAEVYLNALLQRLGIEAVFETASSHEPKMEVGKAALAPFERSRAAYVRTREGTLLGEIGEFRPEVTRNLKLPAFAAGFELDVGRLLEERKPALYAPLPRFPKVQQDISLRVDSGVSHAELADVINSELIAAKPDKTLLGCETLDIYQPDRQDYKHVTFRISLASYERTLTAPEVNVLLDAAATAAHARYGATRL